MIEIKNVSKIYQTDNIATNAIKEISLNINQGEYVLLTGHSGSGKSTLLNILTGIDKVSSGEVFIDSKRITHLNEDQLSEWRGENIGIVFQFFQLIPTLTVIENILLPMDFSNKISIDKRENRAIDLLEIVAMKEHKNKIPSSLSGGEQQRIAIARSLANDIPIIFADEPTGNLDSVNTEIIFNLFEQLNKQGKTIIMVSHESRNIRGVTRKIVLSDGKVIEDIDLRGVDYEKTI